MAGLINWRKVAPPGSNPDTNHLYVGVDPSDCKLYIKDDTGAVSKYETSANVAAAIAAALTNYDLSTVVDSKISTAINNLIDGAPATLDTLNELAAALADDANFAATVATNIATVQSDIDTHEANTSNPHLTTKAQVGLGNADNTADLDKPISTATQTALNAKQPLDGDLTAIAALAGAGFAVRTTTNTWATRSLTTPVSSGLAITNQDGVFGSPAFTNTDKGSDAVATHVALSNPHGQYALDSALTAGLATKENTITATTTDNYYRGDKTFANLASAVRSVVVTGVSFVDSVILATDSILVALGKLQGQITQAIANSSSALALKANLSGGNTFSGAQVINGGLQVSSTTEGFLMPRVTTTQMNAIPTPDTGLQVYNLDLQTVCIFDGSVWVFQIALVAQNNQATTSTTYANVTELVTPSLPIGRYVFDFAGAFQSTLTTNGIGVRLGQSGATISAINAKWNISQAASGTDLDFQYSQLAAGTDITSASALTANADFPATGNGVFSLSSAGSVAIQIRSETGLIGCSIRINSALIIRRITG